MRPAQLALLLSLALVISQPHADETSAVPITSQLNAETKLLNAQLDQLEQRLAESERLRNELSSQLEAGRSDQENVLLARLRQDNQRLKLQLKETQAQQQLNKLLSEPQQWFAVGGTVALLAFILGALTRGRRKHRHDWIK